MADKFRMIRLGMPPELAEEVSGQIDGGGGALTVAERAEVKADTALVEVGEAQATADDALVSATPVSGYAAALAQADIPFLQRISATINGRLVEWVRNGAGTALGGGWAPAGDTTPQHFGGLGDGSNDDTDAIQSAIDSIANEGLVVFPATAASVYNVLSKPVVGTKKIVFVYEGSARLSLSSSYPNGSNIFGFHQVGAETSYQAIRVVGDTVDQPAISGTKVNGFKALHQFGGATTRGGRHGLYGLLLQDAATAPDNPDRNYVGAQGHAQTAVGDGGTAATLANGRGSYFGASAIAVALDGATNLLNLTGFESNTRALLGCSVAFIAGMQIVTKDEIQGAIFDCALAISRGQAGTTVGKRHGILFGDMSGGLPVADDGTIIGWTGGGTVQHGIDFSAIGSITGDLIRGGGARFNRAQVILGTTAAAEIDASTASSMTYKAPVHAFNAQVRPTGDNVQLLGAAAQRWQAAYVVNMRPGTGTVIWTSGAGTPEGAVTAVVGSMFTRTDGGAGTTLYVKETGTGNTGWVAK